MSIKEKFSNVFNSHDSEHSDRIFEELKQEISKHIRPSDTEKNKGIIRFELNVDYKIGFHFSSVPIDVKISYKKSGEIGRYDTFNGKAIVKLNGETFEEPFSNIVFGLENQIAHTILKILRKDVGLPI